MRQCVILRRSVGDPTSLWWVILRRSVGEATSLSTGSGSMLVPVPENYFGHHAATS